jgi:hypothetical protein
VTVVDKVLAATRFHLLEVIVKALLEEARQPKDPLAPASPTLGTAGSSELLDRLVDDPPRLLRANLVDKFHPVDRAGFGDPLSLTFLVCVHAALLTG